MTALRSALRPRYWVMWIGLLLLAATLYLGMTDTIWRLQGRPAEVYPEIAVLGFGMPVSLLVILIGALIAGWRRAIFGHNASASPRKG